MKSNTRHRLSLTAVTVAAMALLLAAVPLAQAQQVDPRVIAPNAARAATGKTYGEWSAEWWKYAFSLPRHDNPLYDQSGAKCSLGQSNTSSVFFLVGVVNTSGTVTRNDCTVPAGKPLFFPVLNAEWDNAGVPRVLAQGRLRAIAGSVERLMTGMHASVDGVPVGDLSSYRTKSPDFYYTMPYTDNLYGVTCTGTTSPTCTDEQGNAYAWPGLTCTGGAQSTCTALAVGDGYYLMLKPLAPGRHTVRFGGTFGDPYNWTLDITYNLTVR